MGKIRCDPHEYHYPDQVSKSLKAMNKSALKKSVKITYISRPLLVRTCDASEFRSVVQQLTGKDSDNDSIISESHPHNNKVAPKSNWSINNIIQVQDQPACRVMMQLQGGDDHQVPATTTTATTTTTVNIEEYGNDSSSSYYNNNKAVDSSLEFDEEDYLWKEVARSILQSPCVFV